MLCAQLVAQSCLTFATPWTVAFQPPLSMWYSRQEYMSGFPFTSSGDLFDPSIKPMSPALASRFFTTEPQEKPSYSCTINRSLFFAEILILLLNPFLALCPLSRKFYPLLWFQRPLSSLLNLQFSFLTFISSLQSGHMPRYLLGTSA